MTNSFSPKEQAQDGQAQGLRHQPEQGQKLVTKLHFKYSSFLMPVCPYVPVWSTH